MTSDNNLIFTEKKTTQSQPTFKTCDLAVKQVSYGVYPSSKIERFLQLMNEAHQFKHNVKDDQFIR
jgi:hypothetical protein